MPASDIRTDIAYCPECLSTRRLERGISTEETFVRCNACGWQLSHPLMTLNIQRSECLHSSVMVDERSPRVFCGKCRRRLDPYAVLRQYAQRERVFVSCVKALEAKKKELEKDIEELQRVRGNLKAQIKRAGTVGRTVGGKP